MPDVSNQPALVWVVLAVGIATTVATAFPKVLGPIGEALAARALRARRTSDDLATIDMDAVRRRLEVVEQMAAATERDLRDDIDALRRDLDQRDKRIERMDDELDALRRHDRARDVTAAAHAAWDRHVTEQLAAAGIDVPPPPPLWPPDHTERP